MRRLLTAYVGNFNRRYRRHGYLFQTCYTSILRQDACLLSLIPYSHLIPLRATIVITIEELDRYTCAGHGVLMGKASADWQTVDEVLKTQDLRNLRNVGTLISEDKIHFDYR